MARKHKRSKHHDSATQTDLSVEEMTPSERYRHFRLSQQASITLASQFARSLSFELDEFQQLANQALERGENVLVAAPTGAGKTTAGDFAIMLAQHNGRKAFYTTPIKALSNQKFHDLQQVYGQDAVGLLTGDLSINAEADIVVMTTEVLRNMLYERSTTLQRLQFVILDEIHYLADKSRGSVWEEVIIHLPDSIQIVGLSATVSNVEDFASWIRSIRSSTTLVVSDRRPVPLNQKVIIQASKRQEPELFDLFEHEDDRRGQRTTARTSSDRSSPSSSQAARTSSPRVNPQLIARLSSLDHQAKAASSRRTYGAMPDRESRVSHGSSPRGKHSSYTSSSRDSTSCRSGRNAQRTGKRFEGIYESSLNSAHSASRYHPKRWAVVDELDFNRLLPAIYFIFSRNGCDKAVNECLNANLVLTTQQESERIERIIRDELYSTLTAEERRALRADQFMVAAQCGFAAHHAGLVAVFRHVVEQLFELGLLKVVFATETLALGLNMPARSVVIDKLEKYTSSGHAMLTAGEFTQLTGRAGRRGIDTIGYAIVADHRGFDPTVAATLSSKHVYPIHSSFEPTYNMAVNLLRSSTYDEATRTLEHSFAQWETNQRAGRLRANLDELKKALDGYEQAFACEYGDFMSWIRVREDLRSLEREERNRLKQQYFPQPEDRAAAFADLDKRIATLKHQERDHPCHACPKAQDHWTWGHRWAREKRTYDRIYRQYVASTSSVATRFGKLCTMLHEWGYLHIEHDHDYTITPSGELLRHIYGEHDVLLSQALLHGVLNDLTATQLACVISAMSYESRRSDSCSSRYGMNESASDTIDTAIHGLHAIQADINNRRRLASLDALPTLNTDLMQITYEWANGASLSYILRHNTLTAGDFVRNMKRLCDVLEQVYSACHAMQNNDLTKVATTARTAITMVNRAIVAYSGVEGV